MDQAIGAAGTAATVPSASVPSSPTAHPRTPRRSAGLIGLRALGWLIVSALVGTCLVGWWLDAALAGRDSARPPTGRTDALRLRAETPVLFKEDGVLRSAPRPAPQIALTFSGGLDDQWMATVSKLLARHDATATFFLTGQALIDHPDRVRSLERAGHEIGLNGYSEVDLANLEDWQVRLHLTTTQSLLASTTGQWSRLFRPPGAQPLRTINAADLHLAELATDESYTVVLADRVAPWWNASRSSRQLVRDVLPAADSSSVIEFPTPPVAQRARAAGVLEFVITALEQQRSKFVSVSTYAARPADELHPMARPGDRWRGAVLAASLPVLSAVRGGVHVLAVVLLVLGMIRMGFGVVVAVRSRRSVHVDRTAEARELPVTVLVAARDEADCIVATIEALTASTHPVIEIIVIDDGSTDGTAELVEASLVQAELVEASLVQAELVEASLVQAELVEGGLVEGGLGRGSLRPGITVEVQRQGGLGKSHALNAGLLAARHDIVVCIDADTLVEPDTLTQLVEPFLDPAVGAVSGHVLVSNPSRLLGRFQRAEYSVGCTIERRLLNRVGFMTCVTGAVGGYRRAAVAGIGGFSSDTCAEDTDLALGLQRAGWVAVYAPTARAHTTVPLTIRGLWTQRVRWSLGVAQSIWKHRGGLSDRGRSGWLGRRALPYLVVFGGLSVLGPIVDAVAIFAVLTARIDQLVLVWAALVAVTTSLTALAFWIEGQPIRRAWIVPIQIVLYRPFLYLANLRALQIASVGLRPAWRRRPTVVTVPEGLTVNVPAPVAAPVSVALPRATPVAVPAVFDAAGDDAWISAGFQLFAQSTLSDGTADGSPDETGDALVIDLRTRRVVTNQPDVSSIAAGS